MPVSDQLDDFVVVFNDRKEHELGSDAKLVFLRQDGEAEAFKPPIRQQVDGWYPTFSEFFGTMTFSVADISDQFFTDVRKSTHIMVIDSVLPALNQTLYELQEDTISPTGLEPWWRLRAKSLGRKYIATQEI